MTRGDIVEGRGNGRKIVMTTTDRVWIGIRTAALGAAAVVLLWWVTLPKMHWHCIPETLATAVYYTTSNAACPFGNRPILRILSDGREKDIFPIDNLSPGTEVVKLYDPWTNGPDSGVVHGRVVRSEAGILIEFAH